MQNQTVQRRKEAKRCPGCNCPVLHYVYCLTCRSTMSAKQRIKREAATLALKAQDICHSCEAHTTAKIFHYGNVWCQPCWDTWWYEHKVLPKLKVSTKPASYEEQLTEARAD